MNKDLTISQKQIENRIYTVRGLQIMTDYHLAELYEVETKRLNEQVKRNINRFPKSFMFQLSESEWKTLQSQIATTEKETNDAHDSFLIIDEKDVYHFGASLKDLGKKWFAFSKMEKQSVESITNSILEML